jgi:hypothetical protein
MIERAPVDHKMVAMQLTTDEGAFICNVNAGDVLKMAAKKSGVFVVMHCAIRLDSMFEGQYELYRTKIIEASSVDGYRPFEKVKRSQGMRRRIALRDKGEE